MSEYVVDTIICNFDGVKGEPKHASIDVTVKEPIVRCRDCVWFKPYEAPKVDGFKCIRVTTPFQVFDYGFCAWGERW